MPAPLAALRTELDFMPSPLPERPGLLIRDPFRFSDATIIVPPFLVRGLACFDGTRTVRELHDHLTALAGGADVGDAAERLNEALSTAGFLQDAQFRRLRTERRRAFSAAETREAAHAGGGYPDAAPELSRTLDDWLAAAPATNGHAPGVRASANGGDGVPAARRLLGVASPHASPTGGPATYAAAYAALPPAELPADATVVILGTSHYGQPNRFGLTRKAFRTPLGTTRTDAALVDQLLRAAPDAIELEDYCHAVEHSIEFQVVFLQHVFGPSVRVLPILCGPLLAPTDHGGSPPEDDPGVARMLDALGDLQAREGRRLTWVLGVDMAHVGRRYGDGAAARAFEGALNQVAERDRARLERVTDGDARGFWKLLHETGDDDLKWCGSAPLYTFLRAVPDARGDLLHYHQWNIDDASVVSFAAVAFRQG